MIIRATRWASKPEHALFATRKIIFTQGSESLAKKVMTDLSSEDRGCVLEESYNLVLASLRGEETNNRGQLLAARV